MNSSKLYSALKYFNKYEQNRLRKYINSPYFNKNEAIISLFEIVVTHINKYKDSNPSKDINKELVWKKIYASKPYDDIRFRKLGSDLLKLVEGFLAQQNFEENPLHQATYLIEAVGKKRMTKLYESTTRTAKNLADQQSEKPADYYYYQYQIEKSKYALTEYKFERSTRYNVEEIGNNLDTFYIAEKLRYYCAILSQQYIISHEYNLLFIDQIIKNIEQYKYEDVPPIAIYYQIYLTLTDNDNVEHYYKLRKLLIKFGGLFPITEAKSIYDSAVNYCIRKSNQGKSNFINELFEVYQDYLDKGIIYGDGEIAPWHFRNIVNVGTRIGKHNWTENFIHEFKDKLPDDFRDNAVTYNLARLYFFQKKYDKVIDQLQEVEYEDDTYNIGSKVFLLKVYYEMDETEALFSIADSFRVFLGRKKKIPAQRRQNYLNLIKFTKKLAKLIPGDQKSLDKIKKEIDKTDSAIDPWILEKIKELEK